MQRTKLEQLAQWRIRPSSIFPDDAREFQGGYATVSRALLAVPSDHKDGMDRPADRNEGAAESEGNSDAERRNRGTRRRIVMELRSVGRGLTMGLLGCWGTGSSSSPKVTYKTVAVKKMKMSNDIARIVKVNMVCHVRVGLPH